MSFVLFLLTQIMEEFGLQQLSVLSAFMSLAWFGTAVNLSNKVPTRKEAQDAHEKLSTGTKGNRQTRKVVKKQEKKKKK